MLGLANGLGLSSTVVNITPDMAAVLLRTPPLQVFNLPSITFSNLKGKSRVVDVLLLQD